MKAKIIILTPVYNDWKNLTKLLAQIDVIFKKDIKVISGGRSSHIFDLLKRGKVEDLNKK